MGNTASFYKRMLQTLAYNLSYEESEKLAKQIYEEQDIYILENFIDRRRNNFTENMLLFDAERAITAVICEVEQNDGDFNACAGGLADFMKFLGLHSEGDECL